MNAPSSLAPKTRRTKADWLKHVKSWEDSGKTQQAYCQSKGLCYRQFNQWKSRFKKENLFRSVGHNVDFVPVSISSVPEACSIDPIKITLPNKIELTLSSYSENSTTIALIQQLTTLSC